MRLYRNLVQASIIALQDIFDQKKLADSVVQTTLRSNKKWGSKDRRFIASTVYDVVRWYRLYHESLGFEPKTTADWWSLLATKWWIADEELPNWEEFKNVDKDTVIAQHKDKIASRGIKESIPDWLDNLGLEELGENWDKTLSASNTQANLYIRVNSNLTTVDAVIAALEKEGIVAEKTALENALLIPIRKKLTQLKIFRKGWFEIQDLSSQLVASWLNPSTDKVVVDACAGAGGKSLHLAAIMQNKGEIIALDISNRKLKELQKRTKRAGVTIVRTKTIKDITSSQNLEEKADFLLLDVPCSGLGTLGRNPNAKWHLSLDFVAEIKETQAAILQNYTAICKKGGQLVYATCSILPSENEKQIETFLQSEKGADFRLIKDKSILPQDGWGDGFYMALLERLE